ncbi:unnamed protein product [Closterium sp. NIES-53]
MILSCGTTAWVTPPCHAFVAYTPASLSLVFLGLCLPSRPRLPRLAFLALRDGSSREGYFLLVVDDYTQYTKVFPLRSKGEVVDVLIPWIRAVRHQLREQFRHDLLVLRLHSDRGGEFSSDLLRDFCHGEGILLSFTLPDSPQQNGIAECSIGLVMEVARTSMIHPAAPYFLWPFAVWYAAHQLNLWPRVSLPETSMTLRWTGEVGDASVFQFYHPTSRRIFPSHDVTFDESVPFYHLLPYRSATPPPPPLFLARGPPPVDPLPPQGLAPSAAGVGDSAAGDTGVGGAGVATGAGGTGGAVATGPGGARTRGTGAAETGGVRSTRAGDPMEPGAPRAGGAGAGGTGAGGAGAGGAGAFGAGAGGPGAVDPGAGGAGAGGAMSGGTGVGGTVRLRPFFVPLIQQVLGVPSSTGLTAPLLCPPPDQSQPPLQPTSPLPAPSPYTEQTGGLTKRREPVSHPASPVRTSHRVPRPRPPPVPSTHAMALRLSSVPLCVPLAPPPESSLSAVPDPESDHTHAASPIVSCLLATVVTDPSFESTTAYALIAELLEFSAACRLDYATALVAESDSASAPSIGDIPTPRSYAEAITGPYSSQWQAAMDAEMASWKSTGTYVDVVPSSRANIVDGMWIFRVKRPPGSPPAFKARYIAKGFSQRQGVDYFQTFSPTPKMTTLRVLLHVAAQRIYKFHSLDFNTTLLQGNLHEEIWLRCPPGFTGSFPAGLHFRLWGLLLLLTHRYLSLPPFYFLLYIDDLVFATADTEALTLMKSELQKRHTCTDLGPSALQLLVLLATAHSSVYQPLALSSTFGGLRMGLVLGGRGPVVLTGHADASRVDDLATQQSSQGYNFSLGSSSVSWWSTRSSLVLSSSCEAEIYAGAMAAQELRCLTYLLSDSGEQPRLPPVVYVDNNAMIALWQEHRLEHRAKHIALRYFLARELQQRGQLCLAYKATRANTGDIFTKALPLGDHQRFCSVLGLLA